ncbi:MAG TPA: ATP-binding protein [Aestuariivirgaceae bacterium]|jgi:signal transduction histidine kinase/CheY-like chemotaxis protein
MLGTPASIVELAKTLQIASVELMAVTLPDACIIEVTPCLVERWRVQREEIVGQTLAKFGMGRLSARYVTDETNDAGQNSATRIEVTYSPPVGAPKLARFTARMMKADGREVMLLIGQSSQAAFISETHDVERRLQLALRSGGYALWDFDYRTGVSNLSPEVYEMLGYPLGDPSLTFHSWNERVHPDDVKKTIHFSLTNSGNHVDQWQTKYRIRTREEKYIWVEVIAGVLRDPVDGKPTKTIGLSRNITEQMNAFERLRFSERNLRRSQAAARIGSWHYTIDSGIVKFSDEMLDLFGIADTVLPPSLSLIESVMSPDDQEKWKEAFELAKLGRNMTLEFMLDLPGSIERHIEASIEAEREEGDVVSLFGICQDISERKALEKKYLQAQKMEAVGQLTGGIAHDFNNLLMVVMGNLQLVDQLVRDDERAAKRIKAALDAVERGSELTKRLLAFSRLQTLQSTSVDLNVQLPKMEPMLRQAVGESVDFIMAPPSGIWPINVDVSQLETAILNLCINARDAMLPKGGRLVVEWCNVTLDDTYCGQHDEVMAGDYSMIAVTDTGCGIPKENLDKVFQPFFTTKAPEAGSGLGLSMIYGFVKQSGGHIKIYSEVGHGTSVKIYLPRARSEAVEASPVRPKATPRASNEPEHRAVVLVVEDNDGVREVAAAMIADLGVETLTASNGAEALQIIESRKDIDLVLSDVIMAGGMNGPELAARALKIRPQLKLLFMSGYAPGSVRQMQELPDAIDLVNKPFTRNDLTTKVKRALAA